MYSLLSVVRVGDQIFAVDAIRPMMFVTNIEETKKMYGSSHVFLNGEQAMFCTVIEEAEIIEESPSLPKKEIITQLKCEVISTKTKRKYQKKDKNSTVS
jgi:hypothetical protein